jgi:hypothetical protein
MSCSALPNVIPRPRDNGQIGVDFPGHFRLSLVYFVSFCQHRNPIVEKCRGKRFGQSGRLT